MRISASSSAASIFSGSVTKYGERYPRSNCIPSTVSSVVSRPFASSTVMTPSLPTFSIASAIRSPISLSLLAEIDPTWAISFLPLVGTLIFLSSSTTAANGRIDAALERHRVHAGGDVLESFAEDCLREHGGGGGAVSSEVAGLGRDFLHHLGAHVLERIRKLDFLGDGHAVLGDGRCTELLVDDDVPALGAECDLDRLCELVDAALESRARIGIKV